MTAGRPAVHRESRRSLPPRCTARIDEQPVSLVSRPGSGHGRHGAANCPHVCLKRQQPPAQEHCFRPDWSARRRISQRAAWIHSQPWRSHTFTHGFLQDRPDLRLFHSREPAPGHDRNRTRILENSSPATQDFTRVFASPARKHSTDRPRCLCEGKGLRGPGCLLVAVANRQPTDEASTLPAAWEHTGSNLPH